LTFGYSTGQDTFLIKNVRDPLNRSVGFLYDTLGQLIAYVNANGDTTRYKYDTDSPFEHLLDTIIKPEKNVFINVYETSPSAKCLHRIAAQKVITPGSPMQTITLDYSNSSFVKVTDPRGNDYDYFYGPQKEGLISSLLSSSGRDSFEYNDKRCNPGLPTKIIDGKGFATFVSYDSLGNVNSINKPHGIWHQFTYTPFNDLSRYIGPRNDTTIYGYDARGNLSMMRTYRGQTNIRYTSDGLMDSLSLPFSYPIKFTYNNYRELARIDYFNTTTWRQFSYDAVSRVTSTLSPKGQTTQRNYSNTDLVTSVIGALNDTTTFKYDRNGRLTLVRDAAHDSTRLAYNAMDLLDSIKNPLGNSVTFSYFGTQLTKKTLPSGDTLGFAYDNAGRVRSLGGALNAVFTYDGNDNVKSMTEGAKQTTFEYDSINRLSGYTDYYSDRVRYAWDKAGNLDTLFYPDGNFVHYEYYPDNLLSRITDWLGNVTTYTYNSNGSINDMVYPNGVSCSYTYDYAGRLIRTSALKTGTDSIFSYHFDYDSLGNILQEIKSEPLAAPIPASENTTYSYFKGNQLMTAGAYSFSYDINGNSYGDSAIGISHNYGFDPANRLLTIDSMGVRKSVFEYDASGNRRAATRSGAKTRYVLDVSGSMSNVIMEKDNNGNPLYYYVYGLGLVYRIKAATNAVSCYHYDLRGSTVAMTDINKNITHKYSYKPFGELAAIVEPSNDPNVFRFVGKYGVMDEGNGIYFMRARYYDSKIGRFLSEDPVWHINLFTYSDNNPFTKIDPSGRKWSELFPTVIKTIASAAAKAAEGIFRGFSAHSSPSGSDGLGVMLDGTEVVGNAEGVLIKNKNQIRAMVKGDPELIYDLGGYNNAAEYFNKYTGLNGGKTRQANIKAFLKKEYPGYTD
jgi:RHS repeat-associated protein